MVVNSPAADEIKMASRIAMVLVSPVCGAPLLDGPLPVLSSGLELFPLLLLPLLLLLLSLVLSSGLSGMISSLEKVQVTSLSLRAYSFVSSLGTVSYTHLLISEDRFTNLCVGVLVKDREFCSFQRVRCE